MRTLLVWALAIAGTLPNTNQAMRALGIIENNQYNTIKIIEIEDQRHLRVNNNASSMYTSAGRKHEYAELIERMMLDTLPEGAAPKHILVLGAGAFTIGSEDTKNIYDFVDIDASLKDIAEQHILRKELGDNKNAITLPARAYLSQSDKKYDVIIVDVFTAAIAMPEQLTTREFFQQVKDASKPGGNIIINMALSPNFASKLSRNIDNTIRSVMPHISRHVIQDDYRFWDERNNVVNNVLYIYKDHPHADDDADIIYTDTKNRSFLDRPKQHNGP